MPRTKRYASPNMSTNVSNARSLRSIFLNRVKAQLPNISARRKQRLSVFVATLCLCALVGTTLFTATANGTYESGGGTVALSTITSNPITSFNFFNIGTAQIAITDVTVAVSPSTSAEDGGPNLVYTFTRDPLEAGDITINFTVSGTADFGTDYGQTGAASYDATSGTVVIPDGSTTATVTIDPSTDTTVEPDETAILTVASGTGYTVGSADSATGTITNDDTDVTLAVSPSAAAEDGTTDLVYTFTRTGVTSGALTVNFTVSGTADSSSDYALTGAATFVSPDGTVTFADGDATTSVTIDPSTDTTVESDETAILTVASGTGYNVGSPDSATGTITNDDTDVTVAVSPAAAAEDGTTDLVYTFTRSGVTSGALTVNFTVSGTADSSSDYVLTGAATFVSPDGTVTFADGDATTSLTIDPSTDTTVEPGETAILTVASGTGYTVGSPDSATGTITNDDTDVTVAVSPSAAAEDGTTDLVYTFTRNPLTAGPITVNFSVAGTADFGTDYTQTGAATFNATSGSVTILDGNTAATVTIDPTTDTAIESDEIVDLTVGSGTGYNVGTPSGASGTITNDDTDITVAVAPSSVAEDDPPNQVLVFTFTRTGVTTGAITVNFSVGGTAVFPADYTQTGASSFSASSGAVEFGDGVTTATVTIDPVTEDIYETNETVTLTVTAGTGYEPADTNNSATGTINDNDAKPTLGIGDRIAFEGTTGTTTNFVFTVTRTGGTEVTATVDFATADGSTNPATGGGACGAGVDYVSQIGSLTFLPNEPTKTITILVCRDSSVEANETFFVELSNANEATINDGEGRGTIQNDDSPGTSLIINTTDDLNDGTCNSSHCSLREAIIAVSGSIGGTIGLSFDIPATDARHFYYANDGLSGQVTNDVAHVIATTATDDATIADIDPDWPHSWWSILPTSGLPAITHGVVVNGYSQPDTSANTLTAGDNAVLRIELSGASAGASVSGLTLNTGSSSVSGLVINRFTSHGIDLQGGTSNSVVGNFIGTDVSGTLDLGNTLNGVNNTGSSATIGGSTPTDVNLLSGNNGDGVSFTNTNSILVSGNLIGTKANGVSGLGNSGNGITFSGGSSVFNTVGGTQPGDGNTIAFNGTDGVQIATTAGQGNVIRGNSIYSNGTTAANHMGIDLGTDGPTANDAMDADSGPNNLQNFPVITLAQATGSTKTIKGTLNSTPGEIFDIDFYSSSIGDPSGHGEGQTYLGSITTDATDANGDVSFTFHPDALHAPAMTVGKIITATATSTGASFNTSEFSLGVSTTDGSLGGAAGDIQFTDATYTVGEAGVTASITVKRVGGSNGSVTTTFSTSNGTAVAPGDYTAVNSFPITYVEGETADKTVTVTIVEDNIFETNETVLLSLGSTVINAKRVKDDAAFQPQADPYSAVLTIIDNDSAPSLAINDVTMAEGHSGTTSFVFTVTKTGSTEVNASVDYSTTPGSATAPSDFTAISATTLQFLPADVTKQFTVLVNGDTTIEHPAESFSVNLSNATNATITDGLGQGTITNDDTDVTVSVAPSTVAEDGAQNLVYTFTRNPVTSNALTVHFSLTGTAASGTDYTQSALAATFGAGDSTTTVTIDPTVDAAVESDETVILTVTPGTGYNVASPSAATGTITNDDTDVTVEVSPSSVTEDGVPNLVYTFTRNGVTMGALTVNFSVSGTATFGIDYTQTGAATFSASSGTVTFGDGNSTAAVTVDPTTDLPAESNETVILTVTSGTGYNVASPSAATGTITNDDAAGGIVRFSSPFYNITEDSHSITITVERGGDTSGAITVDYATPDDSAATTAVPCANVNHSASPRCDFTTALGTLRFAAGETSRTFVVLISQDNYVEGPEALALTLSNLTGGAVFGTPSTSTLTIHDDAPEPASNPIDDAENFVRQHYHDFLNREPDAGGLAFWRDQIIACGTNQACIEDRRIHVSAAFYLSIEFQDTGYLVERLYKSAYGDATGTSTLGGAHTLPVPVVRFGEFLLDTQEIGLGVIVGQSGWETALENNKAAFLARFVERSRFTAEYPLSMTAEAFVDKLNTNAGNPLSTAERNQLVSDLSTANKTRAQVVRAVAEDPDLVSAEFNRAFVLMEYFGYLRRNPNAAPDSDHTGYDFWLTKLNQFNGDFVKAEMVNAFIKSDEYRRRFGP